MMLWKHFLACTFISIVLFPVFGYYSLIVFLGGYLIDLDHMIYFAVRFRSLNPKKTYSYFRNLERNMDVDEIKRVIRPFHNIETLTILIAACFISDLFIPLLIGFIFHILMDIYNEISIFSTIINYSIIKAVVSK